MAARSDLLEYVHSTVASRATLAIDSTARSPHRVNLYLLGKFCEHLGSNMYQGMDAQILLNPTFGQWIFGAGTDRVNGGMHAEYDPVKIAHATILRAKRLGLPDAPRLIEGYQDALAYGWLRVGTREEVRVSSDVGPHGARAQRFEVLHAPADTARGVAQWTYLPLHRTHGYTFRVVARATRPVALTLSLAPVDSEGRLGLPLARATLSLGSAWQTFTGRLDLPIAAQIDANGLYGLACTATVGANVVLDRVLLYPDDQVDTFDPDVVRMLREAGLPLLRWPGGNFCSGYHWRDGVGPVDARPTLPNPAWESLEYNLFGTDEFMAFCRAVGCAPLICVNAGDGTPEEAADWVAYCNSSVDTPMGRLRAQNGHPQPYDVRMWEIGNELDGRHQVSWTTAGGYADRYLRFVRAMWAVDPSIEILACGSEWQIVDTEWNNRLIAEAAPELRTLTHHVLNGGIVGERTDPVELFHAFMGYAQPLGQQYLALREQMRNAGVRNPHIAITELQLFAHYQGVAGIGDALSPAIMPSNQTISEALYVATILHECIRLGDLVNLLTHSATVNHGGGLRKQRERVWGNPVHYAHLLARALVGGTPLKVRLTSGSYATHMSFDNGVMPPLEDVPVIDPLAVLSEDARSLVLTLVHRCATCGPVDVRIDLGSLRPQGEAEVQMLAGATWWDQNSLEEPERVVPRRSSVHPEDNALSIVLPPYSLTRITVPLA